MTWRKAGAVRDCRPWSKMVFSVHDGGSDRLKVVSRVV